ncbi:DUF262 domain-containing protein [Mycobacteroides abscessus]|uniref:DUF262 domain-containing protein n=1 Tax=Mycobacteroides abscessus TaxID=36809 RepID=A0ABD7HHF5_9MYCO|nr:DUF262 domain-containing protein [Mycobacteroides abscessus]RIT29557.1 DUF262 domain-containing protein [Mycobacteroides abscessus]
MTGPGVTPSKHTIGELLHDRNPFEVPKYQRAYAWTEDELEDFEDDAKRLIAARQAGSAAVHFYGGLVSVVKTGQQNARGHAYEVVDGQQRLATFMITLRLVVDELLELADRAVAKNDATLERQAKALAEEILKDYLQYSERRADGTRELRYRLKLSLADCDFFSDLLNGAAPQVTRDSHERLKGAHSQIKKNLVTGPLAAITNLDEQFQYLDQLQHVLLEDAYVIHIVADDTNEAYQLFAVLNDRGRMLTDADLLRSLTLQLTESNQPVQDTVANYWDTVLSQDMGDADRFLRAYYPSRTGQRAPKVKMWHEFRDRWLKDAAAPRVLDHVRDLEQHVGPYRSLEAGEWPITPAAAGMWERERVKRLVGTLKHDLAHPLLLAAAVDLPEASFSTLVQLVERFAFRYKNIGGGHAGAASRVYYTAATQIREGTFDVNLFQAELARLIERVAPDDLFKKGLATKLKYSTAAQRPNIKYFLTTIDDYLPWVRNGAVGEPIADRTRVLDVALVDIEHIYPQNPKSGEEDDELKPITDSIQNLTFWAGVDNRAAQNASFTQKVDKYRQSASRLNHELAQRTVWNYDASEGRLELLLDDACAVFRI